MNITQNEAINLSVWMPLVDDGRVGATGLTLTINLKKHGGAFVDVTAACTIVERGNGWYDVTHTAGHIDTLGILDRRITATGATERNQQYMVQEAPAKESTLLALGVTVAALPTVVQISAAVVALGGIGGIITGVVDAGVTVSSSFNPISMEKGEKKIIAYQIKEDDVAIDVSAYTFTFGVKRDLYDTTYAFATVAGVISADSDGVNSIVIFTIPKDSTKALAVIESGRYSVGIFDGSGNKTALTPPGGVSFRLTEDILDVT